MNKTGMKPRGKIKENNPNSARNITSVPLRPLAFRYILFEQIHTKRYCACLAKKPCYYVTRAIWVTFLPSHGRYYHQQVDNFVETDKFSRKTPNTRHSTERLQTEHLQWTCKKLLKQRSSHTLTHHLQGTSKKLARNSKSLQTLRKTLSKTVKINHNNMSDLFFLFGRSLPPV